MIHSFSFKNFYSFGDLTTLNFLVNDNAPENDGYFKTPSGARLSKIETVIGPNASGKTNLLKVLPFLRWLIVDSFNMNTEAPLPVRPFMFKDHKDKPIELSTVFEIDGNGVYTYSFTVDQSRILHEELKLRTKVNENFSSKKLFVRTWNLESKKYDFDGKNFDMPRDFDNLLRSNASIVSVAARLNHKESQDIVKLWQGVETNVSEAGWVGLLPTVPIVQLFSALNFFGENDNLKKEAEKLLSRFDLGLEALDITKEAQKNGLPLNVRVLHSFGGQKEYLPLEYESSGTRQLFILLKNILQALNKGSIAVLDEFDVNLHPDMVAALFELFIHPETNPNNAQLLFSTHNHRILNELDKYQIVLIEKGGNGMSDSWRLDEMSGIRADENYYTKYIAGAYGAIPKIQ